VQAPLWTFPPPSLSHATVGTKFGFLLAALVKLSLVPDQGEELAQAVEAMRSQQAFLQANVPAVQNQAKRMAGQMMGRWVTVVGSGVLEPVARRWKGQINELAKAWAQFDVLHEADHNTLVGTQNPEELLSRTMVLFLRAASNHPRNRIRSELTRQTFMLEGLPTDSVDAQGNTPLAQMWTALHYGEYTAYYLAIAYGIDPTPVAAIQNLKADLQAIPNE
jgi:glucose/mannose-6-phosphate isomerase